MCFRGRFWLWLVSLVLLIGTPLHSRAKDPAPPVTETAPKTKRVPPARETWANLFTLRDHFERHGRDFKAKDLEAYAAEAWRFLQRAREEGLPAKVDDAGTVRVYDPKTGAFGAFNREGKTKTFFKPRSRSYFERQPGRSVDLKTYKF
jgi:pyocin large subunit-like protein